MFDTKDTRNGSYNAKFAKEWAKPVSAVLGAEGAKLARMTSEQFTAAMADINRKIAAGMRASAHMKLNEFSEWLVDYEQSDQLGAQFIEIPGQYSGLCKPQPELHVRISSFDPSLLVMSSLRKPKRLKIHGSDEKEHPWLVKGGEDLRLDQRVQQLFSVMNEIFLQDPHCSKRHLALKTYEVVPMTNKVGIIQWLSNTQPIKDLIEEQLAKDEGKPLREVNILRIPAATVCLLLFIVQRFFILLNCALFRRMTLGCVRSWRPPSGRRAATTCTTRCWRRPRAVTRSTK